MMIDRQQLPVLFHEFLFRMVDRDLLSVHAQGDAGKLLGRFAAILVWLSIPFAGMAMGIGRISALGPEHSLIATTMLLVSVFSVLAWDSLFPDRRDTFILLPLGVSPATLFAAKGGALLAALGVAVAVFNALPGILFPFALTPPGSNLMDMIFSVHLYRNVVAYWLTMMLSGAFVPSAILCIQAATSQLPRPIAFRLSSMFQIGVYCTAVGAYFLQPSLASVEQLTVPANQTALASLPSYWFLGMFQQLAGFENEAAGPVLRDLAHRAWTALAIAGSGAAIAILASCLGALRKIAEQPDVAPGRRKPLWTWSPGATPRAAIIQWTARTLLRSRQHRVLVAFYAGIGFAAIILFLHTPIAQIMSRASTADPWRDLSMPLIGASFVMTIVWIAGLRAAFAIPVELRANWIFRLALTNGPAEPLAGARASLVVVGLGSVWLAGAAVFLWAWPWQPAVQHLVILALLRLAVSAVCLNGFYKIPFTCAYLPGASQLHITLALCVMLGLNVLFWTASQERRALFEPDRYWQMVGVLTAGVALGWQRLHRAALIFDDTPPPAVQTLGLDPEGREATATGN